MGQLWKWANFGNVSILEMVKKVGNSKKKWKVKVALRYRLNGKNVLCTIITCPPRVLKPFWQNRLKKVHPMLSPNLMVNAKIWLHKIIKFVFYEGHVIDRFFILTSKNIAVNEPNFEAKFPK